MLSDDPTDMRSEGRTIAFARTAAPFAVRVGRCVELAALELSCLSRALAVPHEGARSRMASRFGIAQSRPAEGAIDVLLRADHTLCAAKCRRRDSIVVNNNMA